VLLLSTRNNASAEGGSLYRASANTLAMLGYGMTTRTETLGCRVEKRLMQILLLLLIEPQMHNPSKVYFKTDYLICLVEDHL
jgi:hypothetical protein